MLFVTRPADLTFEVSDKEKFSFCEEFRNALLLVFPYMFFVLFSFFFDAFLKFYFLLFSVYLYILLMVWGTTR